MCLRETSSTHPHLKKNALLTVATRELTTSLGPRSRNKYARVFARRKMCGSINGIVKTSGVRNRETHMEICTKRNQDRNQDVGSFHLSLPFPLLSVAYIHSRMSNAYSVHSNFTFILTWYKNTRRKYRLKYRMIVVISFHCNFAVI